MKESKIVIARHGEHKRVEDGRWALTDKGIHEGSIVSEKIAQILYFYVLTVIYHTPTFQALQTANIVAAKLQNVELKESAECDYLPSTNNMEFKRNLSNIAESNQSVFRYLISESDKFNTLGVSSNISSRMYSHRVISNFIKKIPVGSSTVLVVKEHIYSSYRAQEILINFGENAFNEYLDWYQSNIENKDIARIDTPSISINRDEIKIDDQFSNILNPGQIFFTN